MSIIRPQALDTLRGRITVVPPQTPIIVTIDGPAGTGKSSVAREVARRLGLDFLDTGAMYRAATAIVIDRGIDADDHDAVLRAVREADLRFDWTRDPPTILAWFDPIDKRIRDPDVTGLVSRIAAIGPLRAHLVAKQREIGRLHPRLVTEGRDQGSVVFPTAAVKFYLDADPAVRAQRRARQEGSRGDAGERAALRDIVERDRLDSTRRDGPLTCPPDAETINTTRLGFEDVVRTLVEHVRERVSSPDDGDGTRANPAP